MKSFKTRLALIALAALFCLAPRQTLAQADDPSFEELEVSLSDVNRSEVDGVVDFVPMSEIQIAKVLDEAEAVAAGKSRATTQFMEQLLAHYQAFRGAYDKAMFQVHPDRPAEAADLAAFEEQETWTRDDDALLSSVLADDTGVKPELLRAIVSGYWELVVSFMQRDVLDNMAKGGMATYKAATETVSSPLDETERAEAAGTVHDRIPATIAQLRKVLVTE